MHGEGIHVKERGIIECNTPDILGHQQVFFKRIDWVIDQSSAQGLNVVINMHHYDELFVDPDHHEERFLAIWRQIATRYRHRPDNLYLEPLNEPHDKLTANRWNRLLPEVVDVIRAVGLNVYDVLRHDRLVLTRDAVATLEKRLGAGGEIGS